MKSIVAQWLENSTNPPVEKPVPAQLLEIAPALHSGCGSVTSAALQGSDMKPR